MSTTNWQERSLRAMKSLLFVSLAVWGGCSSTEPRINRGDSEGKPQDTDPVWIDAGQDVSTDSGQDASADSADDTGSAGSVVQVTLLHTGDERGQILPQRKLGYVYGGAANMMGLWTENELVGSGSPLILSSGDSWTGPATSTWSKGQSVLEVFGVMGYGAASLGPRDFDFGRTVLQTRTAESSFTFLAANLFYSESEKRVDFARPFVVFPVNGVQVGVIGLLQVPHDINPMDTKDLVVADYLSSLENTVPEVKAAGAQILVVLSSGLVADLVPAVQALPVPVDVVFGGRSLVPQSVKVGDTPVLGSWNNMLGYHRVTLDFDRSAGRVSNRDVRFVELVYNEAAGNPVSPSAAVEALAADWEQRAEKVLGRELGYCGSSVENSSWAMANWVTDSWLWAHPQADITIQNWGGLQASVGPGTLKVSDFFAMLPFENYIYELRMTGDQVRTSLQAAIASCGNCAVAVGGIRYDRSKSDLAIAFTNGAGLVPMRKYKVLVNSYLYGGGAGFPYDPNVEARAMGEHMREPVIAWTEQLRTSVANPLESYLDSAPRDRGLE